MNLIGLIGKPNVGKSTFFNAATEFSVPTANYPFTTVRPNIGLATVRVKCVCKEFGLIDNPVHSVCIDGNRFIPVKLIDVAGLVPGAYTGRGLGNKFLDDARQTNVLIHVVDASGSTDSEGKAVSSGMGDPLSDIESVDKELDLWLASILTREWKKVQNDEERERQRTEEILARRLSGLGVEVVQIKESVIKLNLGNKKLRLWSERDITDFCKTIRMKTKPMVIAANKIDSENAYENILKIKKERSAVIPCGAEAEVVLRKASKKGVIEYLPGDRHFQIRNNTFLNDLQKRALTRISDLIQKYGSTGIQEAINYAVFDLLKLVVVYPVEDDLRLSDKEGNVLPDARLMESGSTIKDLAKSVHTDLSEGLLYGFDIRSRRRLSVDYVLKNNDVVKIVANTRKG